ncbi:putative HAF family extracellular repeat protein [Rhodobacter aestuarii]|uniref:Probable extracellular repeat, HAF family n=2 Tax=Rhodobacter aestuarii TaxID=453582 RepID=A0A1N7KTV7_9RHOB|nr:putative HAF family extracellular repeat protein [Rhodobacter aestuarii]SIS64987.1 probable extracellular repeat, HAF family [Rhodobacter aestuarii]
MQDLFHQSTRRLSAPPRRPLKGLLLASILACSLLPGLSFGQAAPITMTELEALDNSTTDALAVSADGSVIAGTSFGGTPSIRYAVRWTNGANVTALDHLGSHAMVNGVSADGSTIIGASYNSSGRFHAVLWRGTGVTDLGLLETGEFSTATDVSADGSVVVGQSRINSTSIYHAFRWQDGVMTDLGVMNGNGSEATAVSADGAVVVGNLHNVLPNYNTRAFRWDSSGMVELGTFGGNESRAFDVNLDGSVIVGEAQIASAQYRAFRWEGGVMGDLGTLGGDGSRALVVSSDGSVVAGWSYTVGSSQQHAFRWTQAENMVDLGTLGGLTSETTDMSADGAVVVGNALTSGNQTHAFRWVDGVMTDLGVLNGTSYSYARAVSDDGTTVVGLSGTRAFIYRDTSGMLDLENTGASMAATAGDLGAAGAQQLMKVAQVGTNEIRLINAGPRLSSKGVAGVAPVPVGLRLGAGVVDASGSGTLSFGDIGVAAAVAPGFTLGGALSLSSGSSDIETVDYDGQMVAGALYLRHEPANGQGLTWKLALAHGAGDVEVMRPATLSNTEAGHGTTRLSASTAAVELGWRKPLAQGEVTPYLRLERSRMKRAGYTEANDIGFPVTWEGQSVDLWAATLGVSGRQVLSPRDTLRYDIGLSVDLDRDADDISGTSGAGAITAPALAVNYKARLEASIGYDHRLAAGGTVNLDLGVAQTAYSAGLTKTLRIGYETRF